MLAAPVAAPIGLGAPGLVDPVIIDDAATFRPADIEDYPQIDYRFFRYSHFAIPWLIWMVIWFIVLLGLTFWFGNYSIYHIDQGIPRDLEIVPDDDTQGGHPRPLHNLRFASGAIAIVLVIIVLLIYYADVKPKISRILVLIIAILLILNSVVAWIAFAVDLGHLEDATECWVQQGTANILSCKKNSGLAYTVTAFDAAVALACDVAAIMLLIWKNACHRERTLRAERERERALEDPAFADSHGMRIVVPGQYHVYRTLIFIVLAILLVSAILQIFFTIMIMEGRARVNGPQYNQLESGWQKENSRLRVATTIIGIILVLLSLVPYPHRVFAYLLAIGFLIDAVLFFVCFGIDVNDLTKARDLARPQIVPGLIYDFEKYTTTCIFDFLCGSWILIYLLVEFAIHRRKTYVAAREYIAADIIDDFDLGPRAWVGGPGNTLETRKLEPVEYRKTAGALRPLLGVEVTEVDHPATGELSVSVVSVAQGGAAHEAGLVVGDVITRWNNMPIHTKADFAAAVRDSIIGSVVTLQVVRPALGGFGSTVEYLRMVVRGVAA